VEMGLEGKVAIVTGGASGMGISIVKSLVKEGANAVIADINMDAAQRLVEEFVEGDVKLLAVKTDVTKKSEAYNLVSTTLEQFGKIDILVNDAGVSSNIPLVDLEEEEWDRVNDVNSKGIYIIARAVVPHMIAAKYGKIINIASCAGKEGIPGQTHYCSSKFAAIGFTQALAKEVAEYNINVNAICPGMVRTSMWVGLLDTLSKRTGQEEEEIWAEFVNGAVLKRPCTPEDIANAVLFLSSEVSRNITGEALNVNAGWRMD